MILTTLPPLSITVKGYTSKGHIGQFVQFLNNLLGMFHFIFLINKCTQSLHTLRIRKNVIALLLCIAAVVVTFLLKLNVTTGVRLNKIVKSNTWLLFRYFIIIMSLAWEQFQYILHSEKLESIITNREFILSFLDQLHTVNKQHAFLVVNLLNNQIYVEFKRIKYVKPILWKLPSNRVAFNPGLSKLFGIILYEF